jgi:GPR1/FUN34/yaaH family
MPEDKAEYAASIVPFGLTALSIATFLVGFAAIFQSRTAWAPYFTMALLFGGIGELLAGMWAFAYRLFVSRPVLRVVRFDEPHFPGRHGREDGGGQRGQYGNGLFGRWLDNAVSLGSVLS